MPFTVEWFSESANGPDGDYARIGIGVRLSRYEEARGIEGYLNFQHQVARHQQTFDAIFQALGNYYELVSEEPQSPWASGNASGQLSPTVLADQCPLVGWRFFGKRLYFRKPADHAIISSHERLRDAAVEVYQQIRAAGFGFGM